MSSISSTFGKARPTNLDDEFAWRFAYNHSDSRVLCQFNCALYGRIHLQGKLFVSTRAVAFHSAFNDTTLFSTIPTQVLFEIKDIHRIEKKVHALIFPNALEFELVDGSVYYFASFVRRDKAWAVLMHLTDYRFENAENMDLSKSLISQRILNLIDEAKLMAEDPSSSPKSMPDPNKLADLARKRKYAVPPANCRPLPEGLPSEWPVSLLKHKVPLGLYNSSLGQVVIDLLGDSTLFRRLHQIQRTENVKEGEFEPPFDPCAENFLTKASGKQYIRLNSYVKRLPKSSFGAILRLPETAPVSEEQKVFVTADAKNLLIFTEAKIDDIPFSDAFRVVACIHLTATNGQDTQVDWWLGLKWVRSIFLEAKVEMSTVTEWRESVGDMRRAMLEIVNPAMARDTTDWESGESFNPAEKKSFLGIMFIRALDELSSWWNSLSSLFQIPMQMLIVLLKRLNGTVLLWLISILVGLLIFYQLLAQMNRIEKKIDNLLVNYDV